MSEGTPICETSVVREGWTLLCDRPLDHPGFHHAKMDGMNVVWPNVEPRRQRRRRLVDWRRVKVGG
jgi:hypothetical protein